MTGCDAIMIARGARGNPWIFEQIKTYLEQGILLPKPDMIEVKDMILRHAKMIVEYKGEYIGLREMRKHVAWYTTGYKDSAKLRNKISEIESMEALEKLMDDYIHSLKK